MIDSAAFAFQGRMNAIGDLWAAAEEQPFFSGKN